MTTQRSAQPARARSISERAKQGIKIKADKANGEEKPKRPAPAREPPPTRAEVDRHIAGMRDELNGYDRDTSQEELRVCKASAARAAERVALFVWGIEATTLPQVNSASIAILKAAGVVPVTAGDLGAGASDVTTDNPTAE